MKKKDIIIFIVACLVSFNRSSSLPLEKLKNSLSLLKQQLTHLESFISKVKSKQVSSTLMYKGILPNLTWANNWCFMDAPLTILAYMNSFYKAIDSLDIDQVTYKIINDKTIPLTRDDKNAFTELKNVLRSMRELSSDPVDMEKFYDAFVKISILKQGESGDSSRFLNELQEFLYSLDHKEFRSKILKVFSPKRKHYTKQISIFPLRSFNTSKIVNGILAIAHFIYDYNSYFITASDYLVIKIGTERNFQIPLKFLVHGFVYELTGTVLTSNGHASAMVKNGNNQYFHYDNAKKIKEPINPDFSTRYYKGKRSLILFYKFKDEAPSEELIERDKKTRSKVKKEIEKRLKATINL